MGGGSILFHNPLILWNWCLSISHTLYSTGERTQTETGFFILELSLVCTLRQERGLLLLFLVCSRLWWFYSYGYVCTMLTCAWCCWSWSSKVYCKSSYVPLYIVNVSRRMQNTIVWHICGIKFSYSYHWIQPKQMDFLSFCRGASVLGLHC